MYFENTIRVQTMDLAPGPTWIVGWLWPHGPNDDDAPAERVEGADLAACLQAMASRVDTWRAAERKKAEAPRV